MGTNILAFILDIKVIHVHIVGLDDFITVRIQTVDLYGLQIQKEDETRQRNIHVKINGVEMVP